MYTPSDSYPKNVRLTIYYYFMSALFIVRSIPYFSDAGDQNWFASEAIKYNYDYMKFGIDRYFSWSSRLLIESATMFFSVHQKLFVIVLFFVLIAFWKSIENILISISFNHETISVLIPLLYFIIFTGNFFSGAGVIPNMVNYFFPMACFVFAIFFQNHFEAKAKFIFVPFLIVSCMQEQFSLLTFIIFFILLVDYIITQKGINISYLISIIISFIGLISVKLSPGNGSRIIAETRAHYPNFNEISNVNKLYSGYFETNRLLFLNNTELNFILLFLLIILIALILKKDYLFSLLILSILYCVFLNRIGVDTPFATIQKVLDENKNIFLFSKNYLVALYPMILFTAILGSISCSIVRTFFNKRKGLFALLIVGVGYLSRLAVSFSPTIYVSGIRTFTPLIFTSFIVMLLIIDEVLVICRNRDREKV
ncbi:beta-carotene 15,15'-monooxygenase [Streptococcus equinus]|uniref:beta-carotene 15,15'-monooxygenase n=1 Tax=Streptococcus equinus TaxID=1335 RepID=UPI001FB55E8E|nr:beta-carotene 15,15'-monooxygenase [Streptococcus equinus]UOC10494.1 beta-carotene 15,15'-monooxygenase [Streptococcus equinus]